MLLKVGLPIPPEAMDYLPLPSSLISKWKEMMSSKEQDPNEAAEAQAMMAQVEKDRSTAALNYAKAQSEGGKNQIAANKNQLDVVRTTQEDRKLDLDERRVANQEVETVSKMVERATV
jgi:hypothetical protein